MLNSYGYGGRLPVDTVLKKSASTPLDPLFKAWSSSLALLLCFSRLPLLSGFFTILLWLRGYSICTWLDSITNQFKTPSNYKVKVTSSPSTHFLPLDE